MKRIKSLVGVIVLSTLTSIAFAQAVGAGADYNKADRENSEKVAEAQRKRLQCMKDCDTIYRGQYPVCGRYPLTSQPTCMNNINKNKAQCYQGCK